MLSAVYLFLSMIILLQGCSNHSRSGLKRTEVVKTHAKKIEEKLKIQDTSTGELLRISDEALNSDVRALSLPKACPVPQPNTDRKFATEETVEHCNEQLKQSSDDIQTDVAKIQEQAYPWSESTRKFGHCVC